MAARSRGESAPLMGEDPAVAGEASTRRERSLRFLCIAGVISSIAACVLGFLQCRRPEGDETATSIASYSFFCAAAAIAVYFAWFTLPAYCQRDLNEHERDVAWFWWPLFLLRILESVLYFSREHHGLIARTLESALNVLLFAVIAGQLRPDARGVDAAALNVTAQCQCWFMVVFLFCRFLSISLYPVACAEDFQKALEAVIKDKDDCPYASSLAIVIAARMLYINLIIYFLPLHLHQGARAEKGQHEEEKKYKDSADSKEGQQQHDGEAKEGVRGGPAFPLSSPFVLSSVMAGLIVQLSWQSADGRFALALLNIALTICSIWRLSKEHCAAMWLCREHYVWDKHGVTLAVLSFGLAVLTGLCLAGNSWNLHIGKDEVGNREEELWALGVVNNCLAFFLIWLHTRAANLHRVRTITVSLDTRRLIIASCALWFVLGLLEESRELQEHFENPEKSGHNPPRWTTLVAAALLAVGSHQHLDVICHFMDADHAH